MAILVTGGAGFIGSHTVVELIKFGEQVVVVDNFINSSKRVISVIEQLTGGSGFKFFEGSCCDEGFLYSVFSQNEIEAVVHFAGLKAVGESVEEPVKYYFENLNSALMVLRAMKKFGCSKIIFSSSATVYGNENNVPFVETMPTKSANPYGETKIVIEKILKDCCQADPGLSAVCLRYFNPVGAHESGLLGDSPSGVPNNLMPYIVQVASGKRSFLKIFGNDYDTPDGTGVRDYIHVVDLSLGHVNALEFCRKNLGFDVFNLGTGKGYSVLELVETFEKVNDIKIKRKFVERRPGDVAQCYCCPDKAKQVLNWQAKQGLDVMCATAWNFEKTLCQMDNSNLEHGLCN